VGTPDKEDPMQAVNRKLLNTVAAAAVSLAAGAATVGVAQAQNALGNISNNASIFIDGKTFDILGGKSKDDVAGQIKALDARELGSAIIFRSGGKLYIAGGGGNQSAPTLLPAEGPVHITYEEPTDPSLKETYETLKEKRGLEIFRELLGPFRLPEDLYIKAVGCDGIPNAYFFREKNDQATIRICYEYIKEVKDKLPKEITQDGIEPHEAMVGQLLFAILHEFGHAAFDLFQVPVFGRQEDAADQFATYIMLQFGGDKAHYLIKGAAYSYNGMIKSLKDKPEVTVHLAAFSSDHGAPQERFYNLVCIAYGHDPQRFAAMVEKGYLPEHRAKVCKYEYGNLRFAFRRMILPHIDVAKAREVIERSFQPEASVRAPERK
jgi:hypothetical protein